MDFSGPLRQLKSIDLDSVFTLGFLAWVETTQIDEFPFPIPKLTNFLFAEPRGVFNLHVLREYMLEVVDIYSPFPGNFYGYFLPSWTLGLMLAFDFVSVAFSFGGFSSGYEVLAYGFESRALLHCSGASLGCGVFHGILVNLWGFINIQCLEND